MVMEASNGRGHLDEENVNISTFRRRNKIIAAVFTLLIISLFLLITASVIQIRGNYKPPPPAITPLVEFCSLSYSSGCSNIFNPIIAGKFITDPNQILVISLQAALRIINTTTSPLAHTHSNCSIWLHHGLERVLESVGMMRVNPFVEFLSEQQRDDIKNWIVEAEDNVHACLDDVSELRARLELVQATKYLSAAFDFVDGHARRGRLLFVARDYHFYQRLIYDNLLICSFQLLFIVGLFCSLFRTR